MKWSSFPIVDDFPKSILFIFIMISLLATLSFAIPDQFLLIIGIAILLASQIRYFIPTYYKLNEIQIEISFLGKKKVNKWDYYKNFYVHPQGVHLSPFTKPSMLDPFRGDFIRFSNNKDLVLGYIKQHGLVKIEK